MWKPTPPPFRHYKKKVFQDVLAVSSFIYQIGESEMLRKRSPEVPVTKITSEDYQKKITYLKRCMKRYRKLTGIGRGITGVQVGMPERFSVIHMPEIRVELLVIINPTITKRSKERLLYPEMCMSANPAIAPVVRPSWIEFTYYDEKGKEQKWDMKADTKEGKMYNRVFQHEIDHMDGIINIDLVESKSIIFESDPAFYKEATFTSV